jgi:alkanesulfonate monooxygenase SsuD/methylene tetrahydromethanopterin reductase-like flavin-dependent oxidoreductase (luciferase family)
LASPAYIRDYCQTADDLGFGSLWAVDHVVMPLHIESEYTLARRPARMADGSVSNLLRPNYESTSTLLWVAGFTSRAKLATSVSVLPLRNPVYNARMLASLDIYSGGRLLYGVGVGWLKEEADAMHMPWDHRGARSDEHIAVLRRLWLADGDWVDFHGEYYGFPEIDPEPRPVQQPPPILIGGHSGGALAQGAGERRGSRA